MNGEIAAHDADQDPDARAVCDARARTIDAALQEAEVRPTSGDPIDPGRLGRWSGESRAVRRSRRAVLPGPRYQR